METVFTVFGVFAASALLVFGLVKVGKWLMWLHDSTKHFKERTYYWSEKASEIDGQDRRLRDIENGISNARAVERRLIKIENTLACPEIVVLLQQLQKKKAKVKQ